jgi:alpha-L-fucosidase 2
LLPALPEDWPNGFVRGLKARTGFIIDLEWENSAITAATIHSLAGKICRIHSDTPLQVAIDGKLIEVSEPSASVIEFKTKSGIRYDLSLK